MLLASLLVLTCQEEPASTKDLGTVEFQAGAAAATAQFLLVGSEPQVLLTLRNETDKTLLWERAGSNCWSSHWIVRPIAVDGSEVATDSEWIVCGSRLVGSWIPARGQAQRTFRPFTSMFSEEEPPPPPPLDRWAWCYDFDLPRAEKGGTSQDLISCGLVFAWSAATGPRVFLGSKVDVHLDHFDPFAERPFHAGLGPVPLDFGPLRGSATLRFADGHPIVEWTLTNSLGRPILWRPRTTSDNFDPGRHEIVTQEPGETFESGQSRTYSWRIAPEAPAASDSATCEGARWHEVVPSTWPCAPDAGAEPSFLPARLHFYWDPELGFDAALEDALSVSQVRTWKPYSHHREGWEVSASFSLGSCQAIAILRNWSGMIDFAVFNQDEKPVHWLASAFAPTKWLLKPGAAAAKAADPGEPSPWPRMQRALRPDEIQRARIEPGGHREEMVDLSDTLRPAFHFGAAGDWDFELPWSLVHGLALPQEAAPSHDRDFRRCWLRLSWDPARGVDASVTEAWPF